jgi:hypothetical protein|tara:strand:- start:4195 stop:4581 length:387 start_codon:yes stop_codon:yes gene_type:complete
MKKEEIGAKEIVQKMLLEDLLNNIEGAIQTFLTRHPDTDLEKQSSVRNIAEEIYRRINTEETDVPRNVQVLKKIEERLNIGQLKYGSDIPIADGRDWLKEAIEEVLDTIVYLSNYLLQLEEMKNDKEM